MVNTRVTDTYVYELIAERTSCTTYLFNDGKFANLAFIFLVFPVDEKPQDFWREYSRIFSLLNNAQTEIKSNFTVTALRRRSVSVVRAQADKIPLHPC